MQKLKLERYDLFSTLLGGQSFSWDYEDGRFYGFTQDRAIVLEPKGNVLYWRVYPRAGGKTFLRKYLRLDIDYPHIADRISKDTHVKNAMRKYPNLRILRQDFDQTLLSFILSANNNIPSIRNTIRKLNRKLGRRISVDGRTIHLFPKTAVIASAPMKTLLSCKMGFRAKYLKAAAKYLIKTGLSRKIYAMSEENARAVLKEIPGVGDKIADCVLVYALGFDNIMPLDVWGKRIATELYGLEPKMKYAQMRSWFGDYFGGYAAWAGQILFEYIRNARRT